MASPAQQPNVELLCGFRHGVRGYFIVIPGRRKAPDPESSYIDFLCISGFRIAAIGPRFARTRWRRPE